VQVVETRAGRDFGEGHHGTSVVNHGRLNKNGWSREGTSKVN
jgi:hypothetical protein